MVLQSSGAIKFSEIQSEFGGSNPISFSEYYKNGSSGYVVADGISDESINTSTPNFTMSSTNSDGSSMDIGQIYGIGNNSYSYIAFKNKVGNSVSNYTFNFSEETLCDILIVGGGGSGGVRDSGAGGAGGVILLENQLVISASINVGKGGNAVSSANHISGIKGEVSSFKITTGSTNSGILFTAEGGGKGGQWGGSNNNSTGSGGSGGGGGGNNSAGGTGNQSTSSSGGFGNNGAQGSGSYSGGGGGGAGGPGTRHSGDTGGNGGPGMNFSNIFGTGLGVNGWFAGGGGSGSGTGSQGGGGQGGGGNGSASAVDGGSGIDGTGSGGGSHRYGGRISGKGGDGVVIIRFRYKTIFFYQQKRTASNTYVIENQDTNIKLKTQNITFNNGRTSNGTDQTMDALILEPGNYRVSFYEGGMPSNGTDQATLYLCTPNGTGSYIKNYNSLPLVNGLGAMRGWQPYHHPGSVTVPDISDYNFTINSKSAVVIHTTGTTGFSNTYGDYNNATTVALYNTHFKTQYNNVGFPGNDSAWAYQIWQGSSFNKIKIIKYGHPAASIGLSEFFNKGQIVSGPPNPPNQTPNKGTSGGLGNTGYEIITGMYANNTSRTEGTTSFDNRGAAGRGSSNNVAYMNLIIQAKPGDVLNLIGRINTSGNYREYCEFWVWLGGWSRFTAPNATFSGNRDFNVNYTIPSNTVAGNYALAVACSYYNVGSSSYRSWKSYSLEVWS